MRVDQMQEELKQKFTITDEEPPVDMEFKLGIMGNEFTE